MLVKARITNTVLFRWTRYLSVRFSPSLLNFLRICNNVHSLTTEIPWKTERMVLRLLDVPLPVCAIHPSISQATQTKNKKTKSRHISVSRSPPIDLQLPLFPASWECFRGKLSTALSRVRRRWQIDAPCCKRRSAPQMHFMCRRPVFACLPKAVLSEWITTLNKYDSQLMHRPHGERMKMILPQLTTEITVTLFNLSPMSGKSLMKLYDYRTICGSN